MAAEPEDDGGGIPEWVVTFGDMMSLLLTFFIMLFSMSEIKEEQQYQAMLDALHQQFGQSSAHAAPRHDHDRVAQVGRVRWRQLAE